LTFDCRQAPPPLREAVKPHHETLGSVFRGVNAAREQAFMPARTTLRARTALFFAILAPFLKKNKK